MTRRRHGSNASVVVLAYVCESQQRGVFHPHVVLGYRTAADRAALDTFREALRRKRGKYGFGTGRRGSYDGGEPDRFSGSDAGRYISKYLRPDGAKASFVPLLEAVNRITPRDPETGRRKPLLRPVYVSPVLTRITGITIPAVLSSGVHVPEGRAPARRAPGDVPDRPLVRRELRPD